jgi:hypothetical protein
MFKDNIFSLCVYMYMYIYLFNYIMYHNTFYHWKKNFKAIQWLSQELISKQNVLMQQAQGGVGFVFYSGPHPSYGALPLIHQ